MDETGEDYTEMMCIRCGEYIDKDLLVCPLCNYHYTIISHPCYKPPEVKYGKKRKRWTRHTPTPHLTKESFFSPLVKTNGQSS